MYTEGDHDETEKGRKSQSHRLNGDGAGEQAIVRMGDATHVLHLWKLKLLHLLPWSHMDTHQLRT